MTVTFQPELEFLVNGGAWQGAAQLRDSGTARLVTVTMKFALNKDQNAIVWEAVSTELDALDTPPTIVNAVVGEWGPYESPQAGFGRLVTKDNHGIAAEFAYYAFGGQVFAATIAPPASQASLMAEVWNFEGITRKGDSFTSTNTVVGNPQAEGPFRVTLYKQIGS